ncbi:hypothetical protein M9Y10_022288 [Tritrichomonas musculus]|uniref:Serine/threonine-protein phosphatase n=1 Tax=Tritrichomonas musculus TaxID=1915356 RepID=A0ABR2KRT6_9EUKA
MTLDPCITQILKGYNHLFNLSDDQFNEVGRTLPIPTFTENTLIQLCNLTIEQLKNLPTLLEVNAPTYVVGDLHGNVFDLIRILNLARPPPHSCFIFLGDYVDRGQYSIEVVTLLFALFNAFPKQIFMLRGNHEFEDINQIYGFESEVLMHYGQIKLYRKFNEAFGYLPLAAIINQKIFCVHGGISPALKSFDQIIALKRPITVLDIPFVSDLVWSDPSTESQLYGNSNRGVGTTFGEQAAQEFLAMFGIEKIIRAHQCVQYGIAKFFNNQVITVFSCSNYADACGNRCGLLFVESDGNLQHFSLPPIEQIDRSVVDSMECDRVPIHIPAADMVRSKSLMIYKNCMQPKLNKRNGSQFFKIGSSQIQMLPKIH